MQSLRPANRLRIDQFVTAGRPGCRNRGSRGAKVTVVSKPTVPTPAPPEWLADLANRIAGRFEPIDEFASVCCHFADGGDCWELTLFLSTTEQMGGAKDGQRLFSRFAFDLFDLSETLDLVERLYWQPLPITPGDEVGPHIGLMGQYDGRTVWVRILAQPGDRFEED